MNLRSKGLLEHQPDLDSMFRKKRQMRAEMRKQPTKQITNYFEIKHIGTPMIRLLKYYPKYKLIAGLSRNLQFMLWNLIDGQFLQNNHINKKLAHKMNFKTKQVSFIESTNTIVKQGHFNIQMFDYDTLQKKYSFIWKTGTQNCFRFVAENACLNQMIFLNERTCFIIAKLKEYKTIRTIFNNDIQGFIEQKKYIMLFFGFDMFKMYFNTRNKTKLVRSFKDNYLDLDSFSGRFFSISDPYNSVSKTTLIDICTMKIKACIQKEDKFLQSLFINELGLFVVLYVKTLDIFDSSSLQLVGSEELLDNKLHNQNTIQMAYDDNQLLIFYKSRRNSKPKNKLIKKKRD